MAGVARGKPYLWRTQNALAPGSLNHHSTNAEPHPTTCDGHSRQQFAGSFPSCDPRCVALSGAFPSSNGMLLKTLASLKAFLEHSAASTTLHQIGSSVHDPSHQSPYPESSGTSGTSGDMRSEKVVPQKLEISFGWRSQLQVRLFSEALPPLFLSLPWPPFRARFSD